MIGEQSRGLPPDVRKGSALPHVLEDEGCAPKRGHSPKNVSCHVGRAEPFRTSGGKAALLGFLGFPYHQTLMRKLPINNLRTFFSSQRSFNIALASLAAEKCDAASAAGAANFGRFCAVV